MADHDGLLQETLEHCPAIRNAAARRPGILDANSPAIHLVVAHLIYIGENLKRLEEQAGLTAPVDQDFIALRDKVANLRRRELRPVLLQEAIQNDLPGLESILTAWLTAEP